MVHDLRFEVSGLERDYRRDDHPTRELGRQDEFPTACNIAEKRFQNVEPPIMPNIISDLPLPKPAPEIQKRVCGLRVSWLVSIVVVLLVLTGVGAGVLGSKVSSKKDDTYKRESPLSLSTSLALTSSSSTSASVTSSASSSTTSPPSTRIQVIEPLEKPTNDCNALSPQYTIKSLDGKKIDAEFDVRCDTGFYGGDIMSFYSPNLITCIRGCAMFNYWQTPNVKRTNLNCSAVAYWPGINEGGNCWLKAGGYVTIASQDENATYAKLVL